MVSLATRAPTVMRLTRGHRRLPIALAAAGLWCAVVLAVLTDAPAGERAAAATIAGLVVGVPMAVGLLAWRAVPDERFARVLLAVGAGLSVTVLAQSPQSLSYSVGRVAVWFAVPAVLYLMLVFPSGRLTSRRDRGIFACACALVAVLYLPTALLAEHYPVPSPWAACGVDCPANALALVHVDESVLDAVRVVRELLAVVLMVAVAISLTMRARGAAGLLRRALVPVIVVAVFQVLVFVTYQWSRRHGEISDTVEWLGRVYLFSLAAVALSFAAGLLYRRLYVASAIQRLTLDLRAPASPQQLRRSLASALEDPGLRVVYWLDGDPGRWVDEGGLPAQAPPAEAGGEAVTEVHADGRRIAVVVHDQALAPDTRLVQTAAAYGLVVLENTRLIEELRASVQQLSEAERRRMEATLVERRRIERDLHDGAQQRLLALRIHLALIAERLEAEAPERAAELEALGAQVVETIEDMRQLALAVAPPLLADEGLPAALRAAARETPLATSVRDDGVGRFSPEIERTVYFACMEAMQNAVKHAAGASGIAVSLERNGRLSFEVRDDGAGFDGAAAHHGTGLTSMADRLAAVGGTLTVDSLPGRGTSVVGSIPLP